MGGSRTGTRAAAAVLACAVLAAGLTAGCGKSTGTGEKKSAVLHFWTINLKANFSDYFSALIDSYEEENPDVTIEWTDVPYEDIRSKLVAAIAGGNAPDVVNLNTQLALTLAGKGSLVDLSQAASQEQISIYTESLWDSARIGDSVYAFPWYASPNIMIYNRELLQKGALADPPAEFDEALLEAEAFHAATGAYLFMPDEFYYLLQEEGIPVLTEDKSAAAFNTPQTVSLLESYRNLTDRDILPATSWGAWEDALALYESGTLAVLSSTGAAPDLLEDDAPEIAALTGIGMPMTGSAGLSQDPLMNLVVPSASEHIPEAVDFAAYVTNDENQLAFCRLVSIFPSTKKASEDDYFTSDMDSLSGQASAMSAKASLSSRDFSLGVADQDTIQDTVNHVYEAVIINGEDIQESLDAAERSVNEILSAGGQAAGGTLADTEAGT